MIDRAALDDLMSHASEHGGAPMQVGAGVVLDTSGGFDAATHAQQTSASSRHTQKRSEHEITGHLRVPVG